MKYCIRCGNEISDNDVICSKCGCDVDYNKNINSQEKKGNQINALKKVALAFMICSIVGSAFAIIPLAWIIPMTISYNNKIKNGENVSTGFKVCTLLFVNLIAGILMLCDQD